MAAWMAGWGWILGRAALIAVPTICWLAGALPASAQIDLNQFFDRASSPSASRGASYNDPPPEPSFVRSPQAYQGRRVDQSAREPVYNNYPTQPQPAPNSYPAAAPRSTGQVQAPANVPGYQARGHRNTKAAQQQKPNSPQPQTMAQWFSLERPAPQQARQQRHPHPGPLPEGEGVDSARLAGRTPPYAQAPRYAQAPTQSVERRPPAGGESRPPQRMAATERRVSARGATPPTYNPSPARSPGYRQQQRPMVPPERTRFSSLDQRPVQDFNRQPVEQAAYRAPFMARRNLAAENIQTPDAMVVTPDAVYIDGTSPSGMPADQGAMQQRVYGGMIDDGTVQPGDVGPGGLMYGGNRGPDGLINPYCNDCAGCGPDGCADGACGGCGGHRRGWNGDCLDCGGCCGTNPYRGCLWLFAPVDWFCGSMWHEGPYWGPCDPRGKWTFGQDLTVFGGVHNFRSPVDLQQHSNFGFHEGLNWGTPIWAAANISGQFGFNVMQSNLDDPGGDLTYRTQFFLTAGLFHRPVCGQGMQYGLVYDWLHDDYFEQFDVGQLRGEISWLSDCRNEIGFHFAVGVMEGAGSEGRFDYDAIDQYVWYYRRHFCRGGEGRVWGGVSSGVSGGLIGAELNVPIAKSWALEGGFNYLANSDRGTANHSDETWNVGVNLVWYMGCNASGCSPTRPLFSVADNGSFMVRRRNILNMNGVNGTSIGNTEPAIFDDGGLNGSDSDDTTQANGLSDQHVPGVMVDLPKPSYNDNDDDPVLVTMPVVDGGTEPALVPDGFTAW